MHVKVEGDKRGVVTLTLDRPEVHNAFNEAVIAELYQAFKGFAKDETLRLVVLRGEGKSFCSGADLASMRALKDAGEAENLAQAERLAAMFEAVNHCPVPVLAVVQGAALGGGTGLAACADYVLASPNARFGLTEVRLGILPAVISPYVMGKIGASSARAYFLSGLPIDAETALRIGLIHEIVEDAEWLQAKADDRIRDFLKAAPGAARQAKRLIADLPKVVDAKGHTTRLIARARAGAEGQEGMTAFLDKRNPNWAGEA